MRVLGNARDAYELSQTQISLPGGRFVRLADLGEVKDSYSEQRTIAKMNGRQVVTFKVQRAKGSSEVTAYDDGLEGAARSSRRRIRRSTSPRSSTPSTTPRRSTHRRWKA